MEAYCCAKANVNEGAESAVGLNETRRGGGTPTACQAVIQTATNQHERVYSAQPRAVGSRGGHPGETNTRRSRCLLSLQFPESHLRPLSSIGAESAKQCALHSQLNSRRRVSQAAAHFKGALTTPSCPAHTCTADRCWQHTEREEVVVKRFASMAFSIGTHRSTLPTLGPARVGPCPTAIPRCLAFLVALHASAGFAFRCMTRIHGFLS